MRKKTLIKFLLKSKDKNRLVKINNQSVKQKNQEGN